MTSDPSSTAGQESMADKQAMLEVLASIRARAASYQHQEIYITDQGPVASVLVPLYEKDGQLHIILTKRSSTVETQQGQISFPGGMVEASDADLAATAL